jgi:hypothetical protein
VTVTTNAVTVPSEMANAQRRLKVSAHSKIALTPVSVDSLKTGIPTRLIT